MRTIHLGFTKHPDDRLSTSLDVAVAIVDGKSVLGNMLSLEIDIRPKEVVHARSTFQGQGDFEMFKVRFI